MSEIEQEMNEVCIQCVFFISFASNTFWLHQRYSVLLHSLIALSFFVQDLQSVDHCYKKEILISYDDDCCVGNDLMVILMTMVMMMVMMMMIAVLVMLILVMT